MSAKCSTRWSTASRRSTGSTEPCGSVVPRAGQRLAGPVAQEGASWVSSMARSRSATSSRPTRRRPTSRSSTRSRFTAPRPIASFPIASLPTARAPTAPAPIAIAPSAAARTAAPPSAVTSVFRLACRRAQTRQPQRWPCPLLRAALIGPRPKRPRAPLLWRPGRDLQPPSRLPRFRPRVHGSSPVARDRASFPEMVGAIAEPASRSGALATSHRSTSPSPYFPVTLGCWASRGAADGRRYSQNGVSGSRLSLPLIPEHRRRRSSRASRPGGIGRSPRSWNGSDSSS